MDAITAVIGSTVLVATAAVLAYSFYRVVIKKA